MAFKSGDPLSYKRNTGPMFKENMIIKPDDLHHVNRIVFMHKLKINKLPNSFGVLNHVAPSGRPVRKTNIN